ncbi:MAG: hypothetical protein JSV88_28690 [Candidatus Aminicenantes bacterium]|nr:MAG: hypothetical protein JSV88_28690 [Candidatus Aminicenantes bacterium]
MKYMKYISFLSMILIITFGSLLMASQNVEPIPLKGVIIYTSESWGCLGGQEIKKDVSASIASKDDSAATIQEIKNPEDVSNRYELYLVFPAYQINGLSGSFAARFRCSSDSPIKSAFFSVDFARVAKKDNGDWTLSLRVRSNGFVRADMLYSKKPEIMPGWFYCPEAPDGEPARVRFFYVFPLEGSFAGLPGGKLSRNWQDVELTFNPLFLEQSVYIDKCQALFSMLAQEFAVQYDDQMAWEFEKINSKNLQGIVNQAISALKGKGFQVVLKFTDGKKIDVGSDNFVPHLRQQLAIKLPEGKLMGAELLLRAGE